MMPLFHNLNLLTLNDVFKLEISKLMHNIENNKHFTDYISKTFERANSKPNYYTRHSNKANFILQEFVGNGEKITGLLGTEDHPKNSN